MVDSKTAGFLTSLGTGGAVLLVCLAVFEVLRRLLPAVYYYRNVAARQRELADYNDRPLGTVPTPGAFWPAAVIAQSDDALLVSHGLDTGMFLRYLASQTRSFFAIAAFTAIVLIPIYATGTQKNVQPSAGARPTVGIEIPSLSNVKPGDPRLVGVFLVDLVVVAFLCYMQYRDMAYYTRVRRRYRAALNPANFTIALLDLPPELRHEASLNTMFDALFPGDVEASHIVRDAGALQALNQKYLNAYTKREALLYATEHAAGEGQLRSRDTGVGPSASVLARTAAAIPNPANIFGSDSSPEERAEKLVQDAHDNVMNAHKDLDSKAPYTTAAFVVFRRKHTATIAASTNIVLNRMKVLRAPEPRDVFWERLHVTRRTATVRYYVALLLVILMGVFWAFPVAFIQSLSNFEQLSKQDGLQALADFKERAPGFAAFLEGFLPPVLLLTLNALVPVFMRLILSRSRAVSRSLLDALITRYLYVFHAITTFLGNILIGSVLGAIDSILKDPNFKKIISMLSTTVPGQASFFLTYLALNVCIGAGLSILNIPKLLLRPIVMKSVCTERQRRNANAMNTNTPMFKHYAVIGLHTLIGTVYSTVAPLAALVVAVGLGIKYFTLKHVLMYSDVQLYQGGGILFERAWEHSFFSIFLHQLILVGLFSLKQRPSLAVLEIFVLLASISVSQYIKVRFYSFAAHGDLVNLQEEDEQKCILDEIPEHYSDLYVHPGLAHVRDVVKMEDVGDSPLSDPS